MALFKSTFRIRQNEIGYLYNEFKFVQKLETGIHKIPNWGKEFELIRLPTNSKLISVVNQEVLTKDNIALRFSFNIQYKIIDGEKFFEQVTHGFQVENMFHEIEHRISNLAQVIVRSKISEIESEFLNEKRNELTNLKTEEMEKQANELGITIEQATIKDITFPKNIQDVFMLKISLLGYTVIIIKKITLFGSQHFIYLGFIPHIKFSFHPLTISIETGIESTFRGYQFTHHKSKGFIDDL